GSMPWRLGTAPPGPARFCFLLLLRFMLFSPRSRGGPSRLLFGNLLIGIAAVRTTASPLFQSRSLGPSSGTGLKAPLHCRPTSHHHDGYEHTFRHTRFAAPPMPLVHCSFNPLKAGRWLGMTDINFSGECLRCCAQLDGATDAGGIADEATVEAAGTQSRGPHGVVGGVMGTNDFKTVLAAQSGNILQGHQVEIKDDHANRGSSGEIFEFGDGLQGPHARRD